MRYLPLALLIVACLGLLREPEWREDLTALCDEPQKTFFMSFNAMSKRDSIGNAFDEINSKISLKSLTHVDAGTTYFIMNLRANLSYSEYYQKDQFVDKYEAKVILGTIEIGVLFDYKIYTNLRTKQGKAVAKSYLDTTTFTKNIKQDSYSPLQWYTDQVDPLALTQMIDIENVVPAFTEDERNIFFKMLNDQLGGTLKKDYLAEVNSFYVATLNKHLNDEALLSTSNFTYTYKGINLTYGNLVKTFQLSNDTTKGLEAYMLFGLESSTYRCTVLPKYFDQKLQGGVQEIISIGVISGSVKTALAKGLFDVTPDRSWEVPYFQFYMGDLGNSVLYANNYPSEDRFNVSCAFAADLINNLKVTYYDQHDIYVYAPEKCTISYNGNPIIAVSFYLTFIARVVALESALRVVVTQTGISSSEYTGIDPKFQVTKEKKYLADYALAAVVNSVVNRTTFGTDFPIFKRRFPSTFITYNYMVIFDSSYA